MKPIEFDDFIKKEEETVEETVSEEESSAVADEQPEEVEVQKAVVEALAVEKVNLESEIASLEKALACAEAKIAAIEKEAEEKRTEISKLSGLADEYKRKYEEEKAAREKAESKEYDLQERNPNFIALLDRDVEIPDKFPGETRDHVIDVVEEAWKKAEKEGRTRLAQVLEGVLAANERNGTLDKKREELEKLFSSNMNIINGEVVAALQKMGLSHRKGDEYLSPAEIMARNF